jgi:hypothetical protein
VVYDSAVVINPHNLAGILFECFTRGQGSVVPCGTVSQSGGGGLDLCSSIL